MSKSVCLSVKKNLKVELRWLPLTEWTQIFLCDSVWVSSTWETTCPKIILGPKIYFLGPKNFWGPKKFLDPKKFSGPKFFWHKHFLGTTHFLGPKIFLGPKFFSGPTNFLAPHFTLRARPHHRPTRYLFLCDSVCVSSTWLTTYHMPCARL